MATSLLQTPAWAALKHKYGWASHQIDGLFVMEKRLPLGLTLLYLPEPTPAELTPQVFNALIHLGWAQSAMVVKIEPLAPLPALGLEKTLRRIGFKKSFETVQPEHRQWIDLAGSKEDLLTRMKPKGRYNIRIAQRSQIRVARLPNIGAFTALALLTAQRQGFTSRSERYFQDLCTVANVELWGAWTPSGDLAAAVIASFKPPYALYLYGASDERLRAQMAPYLLHFTLMLEAKKRGCSTYDLLAIAPPDSPEHRFTGITRFKQQFGGNPVHLIGAWDLILKPWGYRLYHFLEKIRRPGVE